MFFEAIFLKGKIMRDIISLVYVRCSIIMSKYKNQEESAYTLLEYCIGAAALGAIIFAATTALGNGIQNYLTNLGNWFAGQNMPN